MIPPLVMRLHFRNDSGRDFRLWLPLFLLWLLALPFALLLSPFFFIHCQVVDVNPFRIIARACGVIFAIRGTRIEVEYPHKSVFLHVY